MTQTKAVAKVSQTTTQKKNLHNKNDDQLTTINIKKKQKRRNK